MTPTRLLLCALLAGCVSDVTFPDRTLPEDRGTAMGSNAAAAHAFAWSPTGEALVYVSGDSLPTLLRAAVPGGAGSTLDGPRAAYGDVALSGATAWAVADTGGARVLLRITADTTTILGTPPAGEGGTPADGTQVLATAIGTFFVIAPDSVFVDDGTPAFVGTGCARLVTLSADASFLLCRSGTGYRALDLETGATTGAPIPSVEGTTLAIAWPDVLRLFYLAPEGYAVRDEGQDSSAVLWSVPVGAAEIGDARHAAWSAAGDRVAYWTHTCLNGDAGTCTLGQSALRVYDLTRDEERIAAVAAGPSAGQFLAFSPAGSLLAYVFDGTLYTVPVP